MGRSTETSPSRAQTRAQDRISAVRSAAAKRNVTPARKQGVPSVYDEMLSEATSSPAPDSGEERPIKKRRIAGSGQHPDRIAGNVAAIGASSRVAMMKAGQSDTDEDVRPQQQLIEDSEESDEDDIDWEPIGFDHVAPQSATKHDSDDDIGDISIDVSKQKTPKRAAVKRKPATTVEKLLRLAVHEAHVLFLMFHAHVRNAWCNLGGVQSKLRTVLTAKNISFLNPDSRMIQFGRSESFTNGLKLAVDMWRVKFKVTASGVRRAHWADAPGEIQQQINAIHDEIVPVVKEDFVKAAKTLAGSQDVGNQLFCALLRSVGVEARMVCSLQPLPFGTVGAKGTTPQKGKSTTYVDGESDRNGATSAEEGSATGSASEGGTPRVMAPGKRRRIGQPKFAASGGGSRPAPPPAKKKLLIRKLDYPVFWVEAFNSAYQKWVPVDATVTGTVGKANKLEPPASYELCGMTYVLAYEENGIARDVTRRYVRAYNAKTRKQRIESTENGERWWRDAKKVFRRRRALDRDQVEDAELSKKEAAEGLPNNVQDFKDHPYYALERHLKRHEVIWPKREVGKINAGKSASSSVESVYRRNDVQIVRNADKWYRFGREIKAGEQALKHVPTRSQKGRRADRDAMDEGDDEPGANALYAFSQTSLYIPPPVVHGRIPKNAYGNLDVYVPSMVPPGGAHVHHKHASKAARLIGVDYADAVIGFQFKGRHGTAITDGVIVATEYQEAVMAVLDGFAYEQETHQAELRSAECLRLWRRFLTGLRIGERLGLHKGGAGASIKPDALRTQMDKAEDEQENAMEAGGFFPDPDQTTAEPTASRYRPPSHNDSRLEPSHPTQPEEKEDEEDDIQEEAPRLRRERKIIVERDIDDSEDEYMPEKGQATMRLGKRKLLRSEDSPEIAGGSPARALRSRRSHAAQTLVDDDDDGAGGSSPGDTEDTAMEDGGGFVPVDQAEELGGGFILEDSDGNDEDFGGGFLPENNDNQAEDFGGGFIPEDHEEEATTKQEDSETDHLETNHQKAVDPHGGGSIAERSEHSEPEGAMEELEANLSGGGFLPEEVENDDSQGHSDPAKYAASEKVESVAAAAVGNMGLALAGERVEVMAEDPADDDEKDKDPESESEKGSLMSHDPDDEDAEPEWLNSD